LRGETA